jgi:hypothetical protein
MTKQILAFFFLLHKRAKPAPPPYPLPHLRARTQTLYSPLTFSLTSARELKPFSPPLTFSLTSARELKPFTPSFKDYVFIKPLVLPSA